VGTCRGDEPLRNNGVGDLIGHGIGSRQLNRRCSPRQGRQPAELGVGAEANQSPYWPQIPRPPSRTGHFLRWHRSPQLGEYKHLGAASREGSQSYAQSHHTMSLLLAYKQRGSACCCPVSPLLYRSQHAVLASSTREGVGGTTVRSPTPTGGTGVQIRIQSAV
jgi:hypothetical protein